MLSKIRISCNSKWTSLFSVIFFRYYLSLWCFVQFSLLFRFLWATWKICVLYIHQTVIYTALWVQSVVIRFQYASSTLSKLPCSTLFPDIFSINQTLWHLSYVFLLKYVVTTGGRETWYHVQTFSQCFRAKRYVTITFHSNLAHHFISSSLHAVHFRLK